ncbi:MAG: FAD-dependent oxidoreductase, partial [Ferruginibacter sp.]|nr:FAD-dependent oxidoreductase [Chitinophagaceae bacterium]
MQTIKKSADNPAIILIGAGIMSATLGILLKLLQPGVTIEIFERLDIAAAESSDAWNNAGTGHSAFCELNYTPEKEDGSVDISKAVSIAESFEESRQLWAYLIQNKLISLPETFIRNIPHMSFVWGDANVAYLKKRFNALSGCHLFNGMQYSEEPVQLATWMPLVMEGRGRSEKLAATRMEIGTDVNFGSLTRSIFSYLKKQDGVTLHFHHEVRDLKQLDDGLWQVMVRDLSTKKNRKLQANFVFIGAGGGAFSLL